MIEIVTLVKANPDFIRSAETAVFVFFHLRRPRAVERDCSWFE